jgi:hypothetical protein
MARTVPYKSGDKNPNDSFSAVLEAINPNWR